MVRRALLGVLVVLWATTPAAAQSPHELAAARRLYQQGVEHAREGRWDDARSAFEQSLELAERPATLLNLAGALVETGRLVAGSEAYRRYLQIADTDRHRQQAEELLADLDARLPKVVIRAELGESDRLTLDGDALARAIVGAELPIDPGHHAFVVTRDGTEVGTADLDIAEGERREVVIEIAAPASEPVDLGLTSDPTETDEPLDDDDDDGGGGVLSSPWFWVIVGVVVAGAAAGITVAVLASDTGPAAFTGNIGGGRLGVP